MRALKATFNTKALSNNLKKVRELAPKSKVMAVLKANAYGHGLIEAAQSISSAEGFSVLSVSEAIELREYGFDQYILLLEGFFSPYEVSICSQMQIGAVVHNQQQIDYILKNKPKKPVDIHLKINTGMNRLGISPGHCNEILKLLENSPYVGNIILMTHFANADGPIGIDDQLMRFKKATDTFSNEKSVANSAAIIKFKESHMDWVRPGIMLYGASPFEDMTSKAIGLEPVMSMTSDIIAVQELNEGQSVGYGSAYVASKKITVGIVACGYADGYPRHAPSGTPIMVGGQKTFTVGRVSMDMLYADITELSDIGIGSSVELWGNNVSVDEVAKKANTVGYELLCAISSSKRVPMEYNNG